MTDSQSKITPDDIQIMELFFQHGDQSEMYRYYARKTGSKQADWQGDISSPHTFKGMVAREANYRVKERIEQDLGIGVYPKEGVDSFSKEIAGDFLKNVKANVEAGGNGHLSDTQIEELAMDVWRRKGLEEYFPGNIGSIRNIIMGGIFTPGGRAALEASGDMLWGNDAPRLPEEIPDNDDYYTLPRNYPTRENLTDFNSIPIPTPKPALPQTSNFLTDTSRGLFTSITDGVGGFFDGLGSGIFGGIASKLGVNLNSNTPGIIAGSASGSGSWQIDPMYDFINSGGFLKWMGLSNQRGMEKAFSNVLLGNNGLIADSGNRSSNPFNGGITGIGSQVGGLLGDLVSGTVFNQLQQIIGGGEKVTVNSIESSRSRELDEQFRLSRSQKAAEMLRGLNKGKRNI